jgi:hypothetical protein
MMMELRALLPAMWVKKELSLNLVVIIFEFILCFLTAKLGIISRNSMNNYEHKTIS